jgi:hypothetical protein
MVRVEVQDITLIRFRPDVIGSPGIGHVDHGVRVLQSGPAIREPIQARPVGATVVSPEQVVLRELHDRGASLAEVA